MYADTLCTETHYMAFQPDRQQQQAPLQRGNLPEG